MEDFGLICGSCEDIVLPLKTSMHILEQFHYHASEQFFSEASASVILSMFFFLHGRQFPPKCDLPFSNKFLHFYTSFGIFWNLTNLDRLLFLLIKWKGNFIFLLVNESFAFHISKASKLVCFAAYCAESCKGYMGWGGEQRMGTWGGGGSVNGGSGSGVGEGAQAFTPVVSRTPRNMGLSIWRKVENWHDYVNVGYKSWISSLAISLKSSKFRIQSKKK